MPTLDPYNYTPHPNDRGIDISLSPSDQADLPHTNGSRISGAVTFNADALSKYDECSLHFLGENHTIYTQTTSTSSQTYHTHAKLFEFAQPLSGSSSSWPFTFEFPWHTLPVGDQTAITPHDDFEDQPGHPLPATWGFKSSYGREGSHYYLEVRAHNSSSIFHRNVRVRLPINFVPTANVPPLEQLPPPALARGSLFYQSRSLDPALAAEKTSLKIKLGDALHSSRVPSSAFDVHFSLPQHGHVGSRIPVGLKIVHRASPSSYLQIPPVILKGLHVRITTFSRYRVLSNHGWKLYSHAIKGKSQVCTGVGYEIPLSSDQSVNLGAVIQQLEVPLNLIPTFRSYLVAASYLLKVTGTFQCADMTKEVEVEGPFWILPPKESGNQQHATTGYTGDYPGAGDSKYREAYEYREPDSGSAPPPYDFSGKHAG